MTQNVSNQPQTGYGSINKIGRTNNGRVVYQVVDKKGTTIGKLSVAPNDCDTFEKSYNDIMDSAPQIEKYMRTTSPEQMMKKQKQAKLLVGGLGCLGALVPILAMKTDCFKDVLKGLGFALLGTVAGFVTGGVIAKSALTPPGASKFAKATQNLSKLDIQPIQE